MKSGARAVRFLSLVPLCLAGLQMLPWRSDDSCDSRATPVVSVIDDAVSGRPPATTAGEWHFPGALFSVSNHETSAAPSGQPDVALPGAGDLPVSVTELDRQFLQLIKQTLKQQTSAAAPGRLRYGFESSSFRSAAETASFDGIEIPLWLTFQWPCQRQGQDCWTEYRVVRRFQSGDRFPMMLQLPFSARVEATRTAISGEVNCQVMEVACSISELQGFLSADGWRVCRHDGDCIFTAVCEGRKLEITEVSNLGDCALRLMILEL
jgi:hypothetical protein